jgi:hypothetical protein
VTPKRKKKKKKKYHGSVYARSGFSVGQDRASFGVGDGVGATAVVIMPISLTSASGVVLRSLASAPRLDPGPLSGPHSCPAQADRRAMKT